MKKYSKLAILMAMILGAGTVLTACDDPGNSSSITPDQQEQMDNVNYKAALDEWEKYVEYVTPAPIAKVTATKMGNRYQAGKGYEMDVAKVGAYYQVTETQETYKEVVQDAGEVLVKTTKTYTTYNEQTSAKIDALSVTATTLEMNAGALVDTTATFEQIVSYAFSTMNTAGNIVELAKSVYVKKAVEPEQPEPDYTNVSGYDVKTTYTYVDVATGAVIAQDVETRATRRTSMGVTQDVIDIKDKTYLIDKVTGETVATYDLGMEYAVPSFDNTTPQLIPAPGGFNWNANGYAYLEQGEYEYYVQEVQPASQQVGEVSMFVMPGVTVHVYKDGAITAEYVSAGDAVSGYTVLPDGNIYSCEYEYVDEDATEYDALLGNQKINITHVIIDAATGAKTTVENDFLSSKIYTESTHELNTFANYLTLGGTELLNEMQVKDGYVLAEIQKINEKAIEGESVFAVLNADTLKVVAELPKIVPNQLGYAGYIAENKMLVQAMDASKSVIHYTVDVATGDVELFLHNYKSATPINNGFVYNGKVYTYDWEELEDLAESYNYDSYQVVNGKILVKMSYSYGSYASEWRMLEIGEQIEYKYDYDKETGMPFEPTEVTVLVIKEVDGFSIHSSNNNATLTYENGVFTLTDSAGIYYYDIDGREITGPALGECDNQYYNLNEGGVAITYTYEVERTIAQKVTVNGATMIKVQETWTCTNPDSNFNNLPEGVTPPARSVVYYEWYVLK